MDGYRTLAAAMPDAEAARWVARAKDCVATLPAKSKSWGVGSVLPVG